MVTGPYVNIPRVPETAPYVWGYHGSPAPVSVARGIDVFIVVKHVSDAMGHREDQDVILAVKSSQEDAFAVPPGQDIRISPDGPVHDYPFHHILWYTPSYPQYRIIKVRL